MGHKKYNAKIKIFVFVFARDQNQDFNIEITDKIAWASFPDK